MFCWSERCVAHCLLRALVGCAGLGATARADGSRRADWVDVQAGQVIELKFCAALSEEHRLQTFIYGAILATQIGRDVQATLFNARTGGRERALPLFLVRVSSFRLCPFSAL
ncbi:hypothetical protein T492DRAFT_876208 [Pavlovales sp. CCMP2436]|nr:hypothetical protein T492DRAFT_876208 [Pavlovales sp. CCMP2436]